MELSLKIRFSLLALLLLVFRCVPAFAQSPGHPSLAVKENAVVTLQGNVHALAQPEFDQGALTGSTRLGRMILNLHASQTQEEELDALLAEQQNPESPLYHKWLTPEEFGQRFGVRRETLSKITTWLTAHGFTINEVSTGNRQILFTGTAAQVAETFHTEIHSYRVNGVTHIANAQDPQIPATFASAVNGVVSLHDFHSTSQIARHTQAGSASSGALPQWTTSSSHYLFPADWATIYDVKSLYSSYQGNGVNIAIVGRSNITPSDVTTFRNAAGLSANSPSVVIVNTNPGLVSGDQDEATLDVEWAGAIAPSATVKLYVAATTSTTDGIALSAQYIVNHASAPIMSTSYGECEYYMGSTEMDFYNSLWKQAASEGITSLVSSGDAGAADCDSGLMSTGTRAGVNGLCSSQYSTCVGGTEFDDSSSPSRYWSSTNGTGYESALSYIPEKVWNESALYGGSGLWASGGGVSTYYSQPGYQAGISGTSAANGMRAVPDAAFTSAGHDGYIIVENGLYYAIGGTSAATPSFASLLALLVQAQGASGSGLGSINTTLYSLTSSGKSPFHATPTGNNTVSGVTGYTASGNTYNLATGLGSLDGALLLSSWNSGTSSTPNTDFSLSLSTSNGAVLTGASTSFTISVTESGSAASAIALTGTAPTGVIVSLSSPSITPGVRATVTVTAASATTLRQARIVISGSDSSGTQTLPFTLSITPIPTLTLSAASGSSGVTQGSSVTQTLKITTGGAYTGDLTFTISGVPAGVTATWMVNPISGISGSASTSQIVKLAASASAPAGTYSIAVTVTGDGLSATQTIPLRVTTASALALPSSRAEDTAGSGSLSAPHSLAVRAFLR